MRPLALALSLALLALSPRALANGKFPASGQLVVDPGDASHLVVRANFGLLTTRDAGTTWDWICEPGAGYGGGFDPGIALTADGSVLAGLLDGLSVGHGDTCSFAHDPAVGQHQVADVSVEKKGPAASVALVIDVIAGTTAVYRSPDNAVTWAPKGVALPGSFSAETIDVAPSDPARIYVSGLRFTADGGFAGAVGRSDDGGASWSLIDIPGTDAGSEPFLAAIDPSDPDVVYVRLSDSPGRALVSHDGATTWSTAFTGAGFLKAFALSPDGKKAAIGGDTDGVWTADTATLTFKKVSNVGARCLTWSSAGMYACGVDAIDGFAVGISKDEGESFSPLLSLACVRGPLACGAETSVGKACPPLWAGVSMQIGASFCPAADAGAPDAGMADAGVGGDAGMTVADAGMGGAGGGLSSPAPVSSSCACRAGAGEGGVAWAWGGVLAALGLGRIKRKGARGPQRRKKT